MEDFQSYGRKQNIISQTVLEKGIGCEAQAWSYPLASYVYHVSEWIIEPCRLLSESKVLKAFLDGLFDMRFLYHNANVLDYILQR